MTIEIVLVVAVVMVMTLLPTSVEPMLMVVMT